MKRSPLRRVSKKRKKLNAGVNPERKAFVEAAGACMVCRVSPAVDAHEIASGHAREDCLTEWSLIMAVCRRCHTKIQHMKPEKQIALRTAFFIDQACEKYNELRGTAPTHVTRNGVLNYFSYSKDLNKH